MIADDRRGPELLAALDLIPGLELVAVAGERLAELAPHAARFDDRRALIAQGGVQAVLLAASTRAGVELGEIAAADGIHVWRTAPMARDFSEAVEIVRRQSERPGVYRVASHHELLSSELSAALGSLERFRPRYAELRLRDEGPTLQSWRSNQVDAGGGVLINAAYAPLETLVALRGLPQSVWAVSGSLTGRTGQMSRETEDTCAALLSYQDNGLTCIRAQWDVAPHERRFWLVDPEHSVEIGDDVAIRPTAGGRARHFSLPSESLAWDLRRFESLARLNDVSGAAPLFQSHLATMALIESIYLAARTGQPEDPHKLYEVQRWPLPAE
ncbi:MAG: hypothetical protein CHACPFDD_01125 [Phycisphaerae bacterium]|nr:hypothetical protein [Phycisphaerae bacterium]